MKKLVVILLEDIDKVNCMIRLSIVRVMEIGKFVDLNGCEVSFSNIIVVMIISIGSEMCEFKVGFGSLFFLEEKLVVLGGRVIILGNIKDFKSEKVIF